VELLAISVYHVRTIPNLPPLSKKCTSLYYPQNVQTVPTHDSEGVVRID